MKHSEAYTKFLLGAVIFSSMPAKALPGAGENGYTSKLALATVIIAGGYWMWNRWSAVVAQWAQQEQFEREEREKKMLAMRKKTAAAQQKLKEAREEAEAQLKKAQAPDDAQALEEAQRRLNLRAVLAREYALEKAAEDRKAQLAQEKAVREAQRRQAVQEISEESEAESEIFVGIPRGVKLHINSTLLSFIDRDKQEIDRTGLQYAIEGLLDTHVDALTQNELLQSCLQELHSVARQETNEGLRKRIAQIVIKK